mmetsp:Transcript_10190/g.24456  ORF Transcript_10190/g.24456 Transcript_10190/m.24456 type:complete len:255 (+) Transcript_10190:2-766(+)
MDVLIDNMLYAGYGKLPNFKEAALAALPDDAPLPWNPFSHAAEEQKKVDLRDDELEDYNTVLQALATPVQMIGRRDILAPSGVLDCSRSRITTRPRPPPPEGDPAMIADTASNASKPGTLSRSATGELRGLTPTQRNFDDESDEPEPGGNTARQVEEAARRLRLHLHRTKSREGLDSSREYPPIVEVDERQHAEDGVPAPKGKPTHLGLGELRGGMAQLNPAQLQPSSARSPTKLSSSIASSSMSRSSKEGLLE